jgi:hypothetical protein
LDTVVAFVPPQEIATSNGFTAFVEIVVDHTGKNSNLNDYLSKNIQDAMNDKVLTNLSISKANTDGVLSGQPAYVMSYSVDKPFVHGNTKIIIKEIGTKVGSNFYFIDYIAFKDRSDKYLSDAQKMVDSFRLIQIS